MVILPEGAAARLSGPTGDLWDQRGNRTHCSCVSPTYGVGTGRRPPGGEHVTHAPDLSMDVLQPGALLLLSGRLDVHAAADVRLALHDAVEQAAGDLVVDVSAVEALDATGLGVLVGAHRHAGRAGRTLVLLDVPPVLARLLLVTRLDRVLSVRRTSVVA